jgi:pyruvate,orthophosphate dikinase
MADLSIRSGALRANLEGTRAGALVLPDDHAWLLGQTEGQFGLRRRLDAFLHELHHPLPNAQELVESFRAIVLDDLWFYAGHAEAPRCLAILLEIFDRLGDRPLPVPLRERLAQTLLETTVLLTERLAGPLQAAAIPSFLEGLSRQLLPHRDVAIRASSYLKTMAGRLGADPRFTDRAADLLRACLSVSLEHWRSTTDLDHWWSTRRAFFESDHTALVASMGAARFQTEIDRLEACRSWTELGAIHDHNAIAEELRRLFDGVASPVDRARYALHLLRLPGFEHGTDTLLWDLSRAFRALPETPRDVRLDDFLDKVFDDFAELALDHRSALLDCVLSLGRAVYTTQDDRLLEHFIARTIALGFVRPGFTGVTEDWRARVDRNHVKNLRTWLELIGLQPPGSRRLISALIINLAVGGVFIADTELFQKDVSRLLNTDISRCYKLILQLCRLLPVYFTDIGAEGELRDVTTRLDELTRRQDRLGHFLRKQVHAESNSSNIDLVHEIVRYWCTGDDEALLPLLPADVAQAVRARGPWFDGIHQGMQQVQAVVGGSPSRVLSAPAPAVEDALAGADGTPEVDQQRVRLVLRLHGLLHEKYGLDADGVLPQMRQLATAGGLVTDADADRLATLLDVPDAEPALLCVYELLGRMRDVILDPTPTEGQEDIYYKRHIAAGIPSMYGSYREPKFMALGLTFRLQNLATRLLERIVADIHFGYLSRRTLRQLTRALELFQLGLGLVGIQSAGFDAHLKMLQFSLRASGISLYQFVNLFQFIGDGFKEIIRDYFLRQHDETLAVVLRQLLPAEPGGTGPSAHAVHSRSEAFYRDLLATSFLIGPLDAFISRAMEQIGSLRDRLRPEAVQRLMSFELGSVLSPIHEPTPTLDNQIFLGAKGYFLKKLATFGYPVPPGFILSTELFRIRDLIEPYDALREEVHGLVAAGVAQLEARTGCRLGDPERPLLLSVRSGAALSLPGAMNTFLNIGMNPEVVAGLSRQPNYGWTSWDCYRRCLQTWGMSYGIPREAFDRLITRFKQDCGVSVKVQFTPDQMRTIAQAYRELLDAHGVRFEDDLRAQLHTAILAVFNSWNTSRAELYRTRLGIAEEWGTAVIVQAMVLGNIGYDSGTGVVFTRDPHVREPGIHLYGDYTTTSQGEDVVAGLVHPFPVSRRQLERSPQSGGQSLESHFPEIYDELLRRATDLVQNRGFGHQELEFTFESRRREDLWILQTRAYSTATPQQVPVFADTGIHAHLVGRGIGIGGGALSGVVAFDEADLALLRQDRRNRSVVLVLPDTTPDDIGMIFDCDGLLTARGGAASHAAVTAVRLGKTCVVNCRALRVDRANRCCFLGEHRFVAGDEIAIDGTQGNIFHGNHAIETAEHRPR